MTKKLSEWPIAIRKEKRSCVKPLPHNFVSYLNYTKVSPLYRAFLLQIQNITIPKDSQEALRNTQWKEAMDEGAQHGLITILIVYVDDIIIIGNNLEEIKELEEHLDKNFKVKQLGPLKYYLGIEFARSSERILMTQQKYVLELVEETKHTNCHISETPIEVNHKLAIFENDPQLKISSNQKLNGKLLYLSHTRPDICYLVNLLSQFMHSPRNSHFQAANRILKYLKGTSRLGITYRKTGKLDLILYTDLDFVGSHVDYRSTMGYCTIFGGNLVTWKSKKQSVVSKSSTEAEFRAMSKGIDDVIWIKHLLEELKILYTTPIIIRCDNRTAISIAHDPIYHDRMKHVNIDRFYIQDHLEQGVLKTEHVISKEQCVDIFTKGLPAKTMQYLISKLGMRSIHSSAWGGVLSAYGPNA